MELRVDRALYGGSFATASAGVSGPAYALVLPGESIEASPAAGDVAILQPAPGRVTPGCIHFGVCGGCQYQHADAGTQVQIKTQILSDLLSASGPARLPAVQVHAAEPWGYRNRIRLRMESREGRLAVGYSARGSNTFLPVTMCPIAAPLLWRAAQALVEASADDPFCRRWLETVHEVEFFSNADQSQVQAQFFLRTADVASARDQGLEVFCGRLQARLPELAGAGAMLDPELSRRVRRAWAGASWGAAGLRYAAAGRQYWVSRGAFFQVNRFLVDELVAQVVGGRSGGLAWDLFAGVGLFTRGLAETFANVVAVEGGEAAAADLATASRGKGEPAFEAVRASALEFLRQRVLERERPELVVLDPPRAGLGTEGAELLGRIAPAAIVYVSCDPVTLARDLAVLLRAGYTLDELHLFDLFPQTYHLETVVVLRRPARA